VQFPGVPSVYSLVSQTSAHVQTPPTGVTQNNLQDLEIWPTSRIRQFMIKSENQFLLGDRPDNAIKSAFLNQ
jgi:hypothetical protein